MSRRIMISLFALTIAACGTAQLGDSDFINASRVDSDGDGLTDAEELERGTDPEKADTDGDGVSDGAEAEAETDPLDKDSVPEHDVDPWCTEHAGACEAPDSEACAAYKRECTDQAPEQTWCEKNEWICHERPESEDCAHVKAECTDQPPVDEPTWCEKHAADCEAPESEACAVYTRECTDQAPVDEPTWCETHAGACEAPDSEACAAYTRECTDQAPVDEPTWCEEHAWICEEHPDSADCTDVQAECGGVTDDTTDGGADGEFGAWCASKQEACHAGDEEACAAYEREGC